MTSKIIPNNGVAERAVLGSILLDEARISEVRAIISGEDFFNQANREIFCAMILLSNAGIPIEIVTIQAELSQSGKLEQAGGIIYLSQLISDIVTSVNAEHYARIVKDFSLRRNMILTAQEISAHGYELGETSVSDYLVDSYAQVERVLTGRPSTAIATLIKDTIDEAHREAITDEDRKGLVPTGIGRIDRLVGGIWPGLMTVLASRPAMGKSMLAVANIAVNVGLSGRKVLLFSPEDTRRFVQWRILARLARIPLHHIVHGGLTVEEKAAINAQLPIAGSLPLWIEDRSAVSADEIRTVAVDRKAKSGLDLLIIDHMGHLRERGKDLYEKMTIVGQKVAQIAKDLDIAVLALHQLSRETLKHKDSIPELGDLRNSGEIEQLARVVWFVHRPAYYDNTKDVHDFGLKIAKNSHGQTDFVQLYCDMPTMFVSDLGVSAAKAPKTGYNY
jgi:replicative DNA helicase